MTDTEKREKERIRMRLHNMVFRRENYVDVYTLTEEEKIRLGLIKQPKVLLHSTRIVIPCHYGASALWWESRFIEKGELDRWKAQYPNLEVIDDAKHS